MSTILSDGCPAAQNPGNNSQICDTKLSCAQCTNATNNELATLKNEIKKLRKQVALIYLFFATLVAITTIFLASTSFPSLRLSFAKTYVSPKDCFATGRGLEMAVVGEQANAVLHS